MGWHHVNVSDGLNSISNRAPATEPGVIGKAESIVVSHRHMTQTCA